MEYLKKWLRILFKQLFLINFQNNQFFSVCKSSYFPILHTIKLNNLIVNLHFSNLMRNKMKISSVCVFTLVTSLIIYSSVNLYSQDKSWTTDVSVATKIGGLKGARVNMVDINNDNYPDMFVQEELGAKLSTRARNMKIYLNKQDPNSAFQGDRIFVDITAESGIWVHPDIPDSSRVIDIALMADLNNDGNIDLVTGPYYDRLENFKFPDDRCEVMLGDGKGHFTLVKNNGLHELGLLNCAGFTFLDYDLDGILDLYIATWFKDKNLNYTQGNNLGFMPDYLLKGNGDGTFTDVSKSAGISGVEFPMYGATAVDWNNDGWPDILTSAYCRSGGSLWKNNKDGTFTDVAQTVGYTSQLINGDVDGSGPRALCQWAVVPQDFDNDGDIDLLQAFVHGGLDFGEGRSTISVNQGESKGFKLKWDMARLQRKDPQSPHLGDMDAAWFDFDNDGWPDCAYGENVYVPATDRVFMFHQSPSTHMFEDMTEAIGMLSYKPCYITRPNDYDLDGDEDIMIGWGNGLALLRNNVGRSNNNVEVKLVAPKGVNHDCIGSRITVYSGGMAQIRDVLTGQGHFGAQQPLEKVFGIGQNTKIDSIVIHWPHKTLAKTVIVNPPINRFLVIGEKGIIEVIQGIDEQKELSQQTLSLVPNPASDLVHITIPSVSHSGGMISITDILGKTVLMNSLPPQTVDLSLPVSSVSEGIYLMTVQLSNGTSFNKPFIKR